MLHRILSIATVAAGGVAAVVLVGGTSLGLRRETAVYVVLAMGCVLLTSMVVTIGHALQQPSMSREDKVAAVARALWLGPIAAVPYLWRAGTATSVRPPSRAVRVSVGVVASLLWVWLSTSFIPIATLDTFEDFALAGALPTVGLSVIALTLALVMGALPTESVSAIMPAAVLVIVLFQPWTAFGVLVAAASAAGAMLAGRLGVRVRQGPTRRA